MDMSCSLLLAIMLGYIQPATPPSQAPAFIAADIARLSELLNLEKSQSESLRMLLMDHESDWLETQARVTLAKKLIACCVTGPSGQLTVTCNVSTFEGIDTCTCGADAP